MHPMTRSTYILAHDVGTTGSKSCLYRIGDTIQQVAAGLVQYPLYTNSLDERAVVHVHAAGVGFDVFLYGVEA